MCSAAGQHSEVITIGSFVVLPADERVNEWHNGQGARDGEVAMIESACAIAAAAQLISCGRAARWRSRFLDRDRVRMPVMIGGEAAAAAVRHTCVDRSQARELKDTQRLYASSSCYS